MRRAIGSSTSFAASLDAVLLPFLARRESSAA
jgi:hypothetical protein